jgi:ABC-2 type transport system ATP-binding protein
VQTLLQDVQRLELRAKGLQISDELRRELEALLERHGGKLEFLGHPTTTLEDLFLQVVEQSKAHPGRRYLPEDSGPAPAPPAALGTGQESTQIKEHR